MSNKPTEEELGDITPEELGEYIRAIILEGRRSRGHRKPIPKGTLRELARWEREATNNYNVPRKP